MLIAVLDDTILLIEATTKAHCAFPTMKASLTWDWGSMRVALRVAIHSTFNFWAIEKDEISKKGVMKGIYQVED